MMTLQRQPIAPSHRLLSTLCARLAWCAVGLCLLGLLTPLARAQASPNEILKGRFESVRNASKDNPFGRDLFLESSESSTELKGDVYARVDSPYAKLAAALKQPANWCDVLNLHINTKSCVPDGREAPTQMAVHIGRKHDQPLTDAYLINFSFRLHSAGADYFLARMDAPTGPLATRDYRIAMEATPWDANRSLVHLTYAYGFGMPGRLAMQGYLATLGSGKVGFMYMLSGGTDASNTDPYATKPGADKHWVKTGAHVMLVGAEPAFYEMYPKAADPDTAVPYVMWAGTPYQHLMVPVK